MSYPITYLLQNSFLFKSDKVKLRDQNKLYVDKIKNL